MPNKWWQVESNKCNGRHIFLQEPCVFCARLAWKQLILPMPTRSKLFSSIKDNMNNRKSNGSTAQCGGPAVVLIFSIICYHVVSVIPWPLYPWANWPQHPGWDPELAYIQWWRENFHLHQKWTASVWSSNTYADWVTLHPTHGDWVTLHLLCGSQQKEWLLPQIFVIKQRNMFLQMQNNALSTIYKQIQVCCMLPFGWFPGIWILYGDISEHSVCSIIYEDGTDRVSAYKIQTPGNHPKKHTTFRTRQKFEIKNTSPLWGGNCKTHSTIWKTPHQETYEDGTDRVFRNVGI